MFNSSSIMIACAVFPTLFIFRICYLSENEQYLSLVSNLNKKYGKLFLYATLCCAVYTLYLAGSGRTDLTENAPGIGIVYFLVLTATNLHVYDGFGILFMLFGNVVVFAAFVRELFDMGGLYYLVIFNVIYCIYSLVFVNLHHIAKLLNIKIDAGK